jgi:hypothetical protein
MLLVELFYSFFWCITISFIWFYTDSFLYYSQLFGIFSKTRLKYQHFLLQNPKSYFSDFLFQKSLEENNRIKKFCLKLISCQLCLPFWLALIITLIAGNVLLAAPTYIVTISFLLGIKHLL